ncbi:MAG: 50S ribosomal protein L23 [Candidatus Gribaldobacteria bacterium]|nr:50S ribosomal protein L23 [Candidatus Gribaldobacteria bacterium]
MALFNLGKKTDEKRETKAKEVTKMKKTAVKTEARKLSTVEVKPELAQKKEVKAQTRNKKDIKVAPLVLRHPHVTEKATVLAGVNQYVFNVFKTANKSEVKKSVEEVYGVKVEEVRIINIPAKKRRLGKSNGWKGGYKKAIVKIQKDQTIELMPR